MLQYETDIHMGSSFAWKTPSYSWLAVPEDELEINQADPYLIWADVRGGLPRDLDRMPVLVELLVGTTIDDMRRSVSTDSGIATVTALYPNTSSSGANFRFCTMHVRRSFFQSPQAHGVSRYAIGWARLPEAKQLRPEQQVAEGSQKRLPSIAATGNGLPFIAIIDDGLPFLHDAYRYTDAQSGSKTRLIHFKSLDQHFTLELKQADIESHLGQSEEQTYKSFGYKRVASDASHGAHLMDVAAGKNGNDIASKLPVIAVQLPVETVLDSSGGSLAVHAVDALRYVFNQAPEERPVVTCMSYGIHAGPHDGSSLVECAIDEMLQQRSNAALVIPAGNNYLARGHARLEWPGEQLQNLIWRIQPDDLTDSFCELWFDSWSEADSDQPPFEISLAPPEANDQWHDRPGVYAIYKAQDDQHPIACVVLQRLQRAGKSRWTVLLCVSGTVKADGAPHGLWQIKIKTKHESQSMAADAWIERDGAVFGGDSGGLQSYFEDTTVSTVTGVGTLNGIATGKEPIVVGAYVEETEQISSYSASGAAYFTGPTTQPLCSAVGDVDADGRGVKAAGTISGTYCWLSGSSVAAAHVTRQIANLWASNSGLTRDQIKAKFVNDPTNLPTENGLRAGSVMVKR